MNAHEEFDRREQLARQGIQIKTWPHQFAPSGNQKQIGENKSFMADGEKPVAVVSREMYCVHCKQSYWTNKDGIPPGPCPARTEKREMRRILG